MDAKIADRGAGSGLIHRSDFTNPYETDDNNCLDKERFLSMPATGELIRMMNYVDDIAATLRRIQAGITGMTAEERKRLAEYMRNADPNFIKTLETLEKA